MSFINGFFMINFLPLGILVLVGFIFFFSGKFKIEKWRYPLLFIFLVLAAVSAWRIPIIYDRRYAMPVLVPSIVIGVFTLMLLPEILKRFKVPCDKAITRAAIAILLIACVAKTMRVQESKDYLHDIPALIKQDCQKNNVKRNVGLLVFCDPGGNFKLENNVDVINVSNKKLNDRFVDEKYQFSLLQGSLSPDTLKMQYPHLYMFIIEPDGSRFSKTYSEEYPDKPELIYEYTRAKDQACYRLFRITSAYKSAWLNPDEFEYMLLSKKNLLINEDLKNKYPLLPESKIARILHDRRISFQNREAVCIPDGWTVDVGHGWPADCGQISFNSPANGAGLNVKSNAPVSIYSNDLLEGNTAYLIAIQANSDTKGHLSMFAYTYTGDDKFIKTILLDRFILDSKNKRYLIPFRLKGCKIIRLAMLFTGDVNIRNIRVVSIEETKGN